jgi:hypothetical protein
MIVVFCRVFAQKIRERALALAVDREVERLALLERSRRFIVNLHAADYDGAARPLCLHGAREFFVPAGVPDIMCES